MGLERDPFPLSPALREKLSFFKDKRVVVTGATGLIGSYVVKLLYEIGAVVTSVIHRRKAGFKQGPVVVADLLQQRNADGCIGYDFQTGAAPFDAVLACAGITGGVGLVSVDPISYVTLASVIAINTIHAAQAAGVPLLGFLSSTTVYPPWAAHSREECGGFALTPAKLPGLPTSFKGDPYPPSYAEPYPLYSGIGYSKRFLEQLCAYVSDRTATKCAIVRPSGAYGRFDNFDERTSHVIPGLIRRAMRLEDGEDFVVWGDGQDVRDVVHAQDVALGLLLTVAATGEGRLAPADPINIASGEGITTRRLADEVVAAAGLRGSEVVCDTSRPTALKTRLVSIEKARRVLGYEPQISLQDGLRDTIEWLREQTL